jgi:hypothetical protein
MFGRRYRKAAVAVYFRGRIHSSDALGCEIHELWYLHPLFFAYKGETVSFLKRIMFSLIVSGIDQVPQHPSWVVEKCFGNAIVLGILVGDG